MRTFKIKVISFLVILIFVSSYSQEFEVSSKIIDAEIIDSSTLPSGIKGPSILQVPGYFVWGGTVVKGDDNKYHMLFSLWESGLKDGNFIKNWVLESKLGYAVSDYPDREFKFQKIILQGTRYHGDSTSWDSQMVHNPHIKKFNGNYYLYYIGSRDPGVQEKGSTGEGLNKRSRVQQNQCTGVIEFSNFQDLLSGNFMRPKEPLLRARTRVKPNNVLLGSPEGTAAKPDNLIVVNPSVDYNPITQKYMLFFKGNLYEPNWKGAHGVAIGNSPVGPFKPLDKFIFDVKMPDGSIASTEDPYVWYSNKYKKFFAVVKDFTGRLSGHKTALALLKSNDGITWDMAKNPTFMKKELHLSNETVIKTHHLERPQLLLDEDGIPKIMYAACSLVNLSNLNNGATFNVQIPLKITVNE